MAELDPYIHQPTRLRIMMLLSGVAAVDFNFVRSTLGLTKGNISAHISRLEQAGYIKVTKSFQGKIPHTVYRLTAEGKRQLARYWQTMDEIRAPRQE